MKTTRLLAATVGVLLLIGTKTAHAAEKVVWAKSLGTALAEAKKSKKLVMVDFYTDWCHWCKVLDQRTYTDSRFVKAAKQIVAVKVNAEKEGAAAAQKYQVGGFPTVIFLTPEGSVAGRIGGYAPAEPFVAQMQQFITTYKELPGLEAKAADGSADAATLAKLTTIYADRDDTKKAALTLAKLERTHPENAGEKLAKAYLWTGMMYQKAEQFDKAIPLFRKAAKVSKVSDDKAAAYFNSAVCRFATGKSKEAVPDLKAFLAVPGVPADAKQQAQKMLQVARMGH